MTTSKQANVKTAAAALGDEMVRSTGSGAISEFIQVDKPTKLLGVKLHLSAAATTGNLLISTLGTRSGLDAYNTVLLNADMNGVQDIHFSDPVFLGKGDDIAIAFVNADGRTYGLTVIYADA